MSSAHRQKDEGAINWVPCHERRSLAEKGGSPPRLKTGSNPMQEPIDPSVMIINVEDYPGLNPTTQDGKDQLSAIGFQASHDHPGKNHFLFMHKGEQIGQMITRSMFKIVDGQLRENKPD